MVSEKNEVTSQNLAVKRDLVKDHVRLMLQKLIATKTPTQGNIQTNSVKDAAQRDRE